MTEVTVDQLKQLIAEASQELAAATDAAGLEAWRVKYLGRKGLLPTLLREVKGLQVEQRRAVGVLGNTGRRDLESAYQLAVQRLAKPASAAISSEPVVPVTKLAGLPAQGHLHPITITMRRIQLFFTGLGFQHISGPEVEEARNNFDNLNIPLEHPARLETDTFYIDPATVLRTATSTVQVRGVLELDLVPPFKIFSPGRVFRAEKPDPTHGHTFHQVEGLVVGQDATIADFKGVAEALYANLLGQEVVTRLRPHYFPFVEPGFELDIGCVFCGQRGCRICKNSGWIEMMGAGMVHPNVLRNMNIDPDHVQGYAFGAGIDRLAMLLYNIDDMRLFWSGNLQFLQQFP